MGPLIEIDDPRDPRLADYFGLTDVELRRRLEPEQSLFIAEGDLVIRRAMDKGFPVRSFLVSPRWLEGLAEVRAQCDVPTFVMSPEVLEQTTGFHVHRGALAAMGRLPLPSVQEVLEHSTRVAVLEDINSHTNLGAIFRCAAGLGMEAVLLTPSCADPLYRRSMRVSMGQVLSVPYARLERWPRDLSLLSDAGFTVLALTPDPEAVSLEELDTRAMPKVAMILGTEGPGLAERTMRGADLRVRIPMHGGVDSLNVAAAAAVAFFVAGRR